MNGKKNIIYTSKYDTDVSKFMRSLNEDLMLKDLCKILDIKYSSLHNMFKRNSISYNVFGKILMHFKDLTEEQIIELRRLTK